MAAQDLIELIECIAEMLDAEGAVYAITGSVASSIHGEPCTSLDLDVVVQMSPDQAAGVARRASGRFYVDPEMLRDAAVCHGMANLVDHRTAYKIDLSILEVTPYHREIMRRRVRIKLPQTGRECWVVSPEDIILMKLVWRKESQSRKQWENALGVVRARQHQLDWAYLREWAGILGIGADLETLVREAGA